MKGSSEERAVADKEVPKWLFGRLTPNEKTTIEIWGKTGIRPNELSSKGMNNKKGTLFKRTHIWND